MLSLLLQNLVEIATFPFTEVSELREKYTYNITPWSLGIGVAKKGLRILYSDDEEDDDDDADVAATFGVANIFKGSPKTSPSRPNLKKMVGPSQQNVDKERLTVDISALRQQYKKLRQRQTQAQIILTCKLKFFVSNQSCQKSQFFSCMEQKWNFARQWNYQQFRGQKYWNWSLQCIHGNESFTIGKETIDNKTTTTSPSRRYSSTQGQKAIRRN